MPRVSQVLNWYGTEWILRRFLITSALWCYDLLQHEAAEGSPFHVDGAVPWPQINLSRPFCPSPLLCLLGESTLFQGQGGKIERTARWVLIWPRETKFRSIPGEMLGFFFRNAFVSEPLGGLVLLILPARPGGWVEGSGEPFWEQASVLFPQSCEPSWDGKPVAFPQVMGSSLSLSLPLVPASRPCQLHLDKPYLWQKQKNPYE